jgi:hypothetical protein
MVQFVQGTERQQRCWLTTSKSNPRHTPRQNESRSLVYINRHTVATRNPERNPKILADLCRLLT